MLRLFRLCALLGVVAVFATCIREVELDQDPDPNALIVDAVLNAGAGPHVVKLSRTADYFVRDFRQVPGATVTLSNDLGQSWQYTEVNAGTEQAYYRLTGMEARVGETYRLDIVLADGTRYQSSPERMPEGIVLDTVSLRGEKRQVNRDDGEVRTINYAIVEANTVLPATLPKAYLYWEVSSVFRFRDMDFSPGKPAKACYVPDFFNRNNLPTLDLSTVAPGSALRLEVAQREMDYTFEYKLGFVVSQKVITASAYEYLQKVNALLNQTGTALDAPPALPIGNVQNLTEPTRPAVGIFLVASSDQATTTMSNGDLPGFFVTNQYCQLNAANNPPVNYYECWDCLSLPGSSLTPPSWWQ
jgi:hypothetical protein